MRRDPVSGIGLGGARACTINELTLFQDSDGGPGSIGDLLRSFRNQRGGGSQIQLQGLNQLLSFDDAGKIVGKLGVGSLGPQAVVVLLQHECRSQKLLEGSFIQNRLTLRAGSSLRHVSELLRQPVRDSGNTIVMQSAIQTEG